MFLCVSFALAVIARRIGGALFLVRNPLRLDNVLSDDVMDMLDKGKLDMAHAWAGIVATQNELQEVNEAFQSLREFQEVLDLMSSKGIDAWHGVLRKHFRIESAQDLRTNDIAPEQLQQIISDMRIEMTEEQILDLHSLLQSAEDTVSASELTKAKQRSDALLDETFGQRLRPTLSMWKSWADPRMQATLDSFIRGLETMKQEQLFATIPKCLRRQLVEAAQIKNSPLRRDSMRRVSTKKSSEKTEVQPGRLTWSATQLREVRTARDPLSLEDAHERLKKRLDGTRDWVLTRAGRIMTLSVVFGVLALGAYIFVSQAACCPPQLAC